MYVGTIMSFQLFELADLEQAWLWLALSLVRLTERTKHRNVTLIDVTLIHR